MLSFATHDLRLTGCVGGRLGRDIKSLNGLYGFDHSIFVYWQKDEPSKLEYFMVPGTKQLDLERLFGETWREVHWMQLLLVEENVVRALRQETPGQPLLGGDVPMADNDGPPPHPPGPPGGGHVGRSRSRSRERNPPDRTSQNNMVGTYW